LTYVVATVVGLATLWVIFVVALVIARPKGLRPADAARLMPDLVRLARDLARDREIPRHVRARIWFLVAWMLSPIDLIPDVIPVIGVADDAVLAYFVLRSVVRAAGRDVLARNWRGRPEGLLAVERMLRLESDSTG